MLDEYVIGQDDAKVALAVAVYNHYKRIYYGVEDGEITKSNVLLLGPTGVGQNFACPNACKVAGCSLCHCRRHYFDRSRLCWRRRREYFAAFNPGQQILTSKKQSAVLFILMKLIKLPVNLKTHPLHVM